MSESQEPQETQHERVQDDEGRDPHTLEDLAAALLREANERRGFTEER